MNSRIYLTLSLLTVSIFVTDKTSALVTLNTSPTPLESQNWVSKKPVVVTDLVEQLRTANVGERRKIIQQLSDSEQNIVPELIEAIKDPDPLVKSGVAEVLGNLTDAAVPAIPALIEMMSSTQRAIVPQSSSLTPPLPIPYIPRNISLENRQQRRIPPDPPENPSNQLRITAIVAIGKIGLPARTAATPPLLRATQDPDPWVKLNATWALAEIGASTPLLAYWLEAIQHPDPRLRSSAASVFLDSSSLLRKVFGSEASASTTAPLLAALKDEDSEIRSAAKTGLELLGTKALPGLIQALKAPEPIVRLEVAKLLGNMGVTAQPALPNLLQLLTDTGRYVPPSTNGTRLLIPSVPALSLPGRYPMPDNPEKLVRVNVAIALGQLGERKAIPSLTTALKDNNPWMQLATNWALTRLGQNQGLPVIGRLLQHPNPSVQYEALLQLERYGKESIPYLLPYYKAQLDSSDDNKRHGAIIGIGNMGVAALNLVPKLRTILTGNNRDSKGYAATILGQIARDVASSWQNGNLSTQQRQQAITEFTKALRIMQAPNARFNAEPKERIRNALTILSK